MNRMVLVIDDQPDIVLMVKLILELEGDQVIGAGSGSTSLRRAATRVTATREADGSGTRSASSSGAAGAPCARRAAPRARS